MIGRERTKLIHEGSYVAEVEVAEVEVELPEESGGWSPYLSLEDAYRLDDVREALRRGEVETAARYSRVFSLTPVAVQGSFNGRTRDESRIVESIVRQESAPRKVFAGQRCAIPEILHPFPGQTSKNRTYRDRDPDT